MATCSGSWMSTVIPTRTSASSLGAWEIASSLGISTATGGMTWPTCVQNLWDIQPDVRIAGSPTKEPTPQSATRPILFSIPRLSGASMGSKGTLPLSATSTATTSTKSASSRRSPKMGNCSGISPAIRHSSSTVSPMTLQSSVIGTATATMTWESCAKTRTRRIQWGY